MRLQNYGLRGLLARRGRHRDENIANLVASHLKSPLGGEVKKESHNALLMFRRAWDLGYLIKKSPNRVAGQKGLFAVYH